MDEQLFNLLKQILPSNPIVLNKGQVKFYCPICNHYKQKLEINLNPESEKFLYYHCWTCENTKGKSIYSLFKLLNVSKDKIDILNNLLKKYNRHYVPKELNDINFDSIISTDNEIKETVILPNEYKPILNYNQELPEIKLVNSIFKKRHITKTDILRYRIGFCEYGNYANCIIFPSYDNYGMLNYFVAKHIYTNNYINTKFSKNIVMFENLISWYFPVILCEGIIDAITIKRNAIPILGTIMRPNLINKISIHKPITYIMLDGDAIDKSIKIAEVLNKRGVETYLVELDSIKDDPNSIGFDNCWNKINSSKRFNESSSLDKILINL